MQVPHHRSCIRDQRPPNETAVSYTTVRKRLWKKSLSFCLWQGIYSVHIPLYTPVHFSRESGKGKIQPLQLTIEEIFAGSLGLARRILLLPDRTEILAEYLN